MRVISQDGRLDFPYERSIVFLSLEDATIVQIQAIGDDEAGTLAKYSTEEKAKKAMELLRIAYTGRFITNTEVSQDFEKEMKELMKGGFGTVMVRDSGSRVEFNNLNGYFQFPTEEELE